MLSILPFAFLVLAARSAARHRQEPELASDLRDALLVGAVLTGFWAVAGAEALSLFHSFDRGSVTAWWLAGLALLGMLTLHRQESGPALNWRPDMARINLMLLGIGTVFVIATALIAFLTPPSTPDCLSYHLPRQLYWIQNHSVAQYPAIQLSQVEMPPMAEYLGAQLMLLSGNDHQANLVQWFSYILCAAAASAIARDLGAGSRTQTVASLLVLLHPGAALEAVNEKNDLVESLWLLILVWAGVRVWVSRRLSPGMAGLGGAALGLLLLTKGTAFVFGPAVCLFIAIGALRTGVRRSLALGTCIVLLAAVINLPHMYRNYLYQDHPIALPAGRGGYALTNELHTPAAIVSNALRTLTLHTNTRFAEVNAWQKRQVERAHRHLGIDVVDRRTTPAYVTEFNIVPNWADDGNNPSHVLLALAALMTLGFRPRRLIQRRAWPIFLAPYISLGLFLFVLKWQPCNARLQLPLFLSMAPLLAVVAARRAVLAMLSVGLSIFLCAQAILFNSCKPLLGPHSILNKTREAITDQFDLAQLPQAKAAVARIAELHPELLSLDLRPHSNEYSVLRLIQDTVKPAPHLSTFRPVHGPPPSAQAPDVVLSTWPWPAGAMYHAPSGTLFRCIDSKGQYRVYLPADRVDPSTLLPTLPAFYGWNWDQGLNPPQGPFPELDLPVVRWASALKVEIQFDSDGVPTTLVLESRRNDNTDQVMTILHGHTPVHRLEFGSGFEFLPVQVQLHPKKGPNVVSLLFANLSSSNPTRAALFRKLQVIPSSWVTAAPEPKP